MEFKKEIAMTKSERVKYQKILKTYKDRGSRYYMNVRWLRAQLHDLFHRIEVEGIVQAIR